MREQMKKAKLMPPTFESNRETNQFTIRLLFHHLLGKDDIEWLSLFAKYELNNEQKLSLIFIRELGAIDNITYRQLNSDITSRKATVDLHRMCEKGLFELKGQSRKAYYIAGQEFMKLNGKADGEISKADGEISKADGEISKADGEISRVDGEISRADGEISRAGGEISRANGEISRANGEISRAFPETIIDRIRGIKKWAPAYEMEKIILEMCEIKPLSLNELSELLSRKPTSIRYQYINPLLKQGKLFYTIPEMLNHPNQKYTTKKKQ
jgi:ATP-dependent DNA helicase RecG